jgi:hypothetical protein
MTILKGSSEEGTGSGADRPYALVGSRYARSVNGPVPAEERMAEAIAGYPPQVLSFMLSVLSTRDDEARARRIGELHAHERSRGLAELLIDLEEDSAARALVVGMPGRRSVDG